MIDVTGWLVVKCNQITMLDVITVLTVSAQRQRHSGELWPTVMSHQQALTSHHHGKQEHLSYHPQISVVQFPQKPSILPMGRGRGGLEVRDEESGHYPGHEGENDWDQSGSCSLERCQVYVHVSLISPPWWCQCGQAETGLHCPMGCHKPANSSGDPHKTPAAGGQKVKFTDSRHYDQI